MSVWITVPSARPVEQVREWAKAWRERGYRLALWRDEPGISPGDIGKVWCPGWSEGYPGYAVAVNRLVKAAMDSDESAEWFIAAGDDTFPDPNKTADEIARECEGYFTKLHYGNEAHHAAEVGPLSTFGVCQPTGDRWQEGQGGFQNAPIDRVAGSAWYGREYCRRINQGRGPLWPEYTHCFVDEEAQLVAQKYGVFWQRRDLTHLHKHWARGKGLHDLVDASNCPAFLAEANSEAHWKKYKGIFEARKSSGFPGSEPLA